ncbi:hypothetical protein PFISCL1PPCAC_13131, partial [Pristionchus fissidentatus]
MPKKGVSKKTDRKCLICRSETRVAHLGIDVCRACAIFYRRAERGNSFSCRSGTHQCAIGEGLTCKRCRFDYISKLLKRSDVPSTSHNYGNPTSELDADIACSALSKPVSQRRASAMPPQALVTNSTSLPLLERLKMHYRTMCLSRLNTELHTRASPPHPSRISLKDGPFFPSTFAALNMANRVLLSSMLEFGACVFPEFANLHEKERWDIVVNCFYRFRIF